jgi:hypothetical protein
VEGDRPEASLNKRERKKRREQNEDRAYGYGKRSTDKKRAESRDEERDNDGLLKVKETEKKAKMQKQQHTAQESLTLVRPMRSPAQPPPADPMKPQRLITTKVLKRNRHRAIDR